MQTFWPWHCWNKYSSKTSLSCCLGDFLYLSFCLLTFLLLHYRDWQPKSFGHGRWICHVGRVCWQCGGFVTYLVSIPQAFPGPLGSTVYENHCHSVCFYDRGFVISYEYSMSMGEVIFDSLKIWRKKIIYLFSCCVMKLGKVAFCKVLHLCLKYKETNFWDVSCDLQGCKCFLFFRISYFFNACAHSPFLKFKMWLKKKVFSAL